MPQTTSKSPFGKHSNALVYQISKHEVIYLGNGSASLARLCAVNNNWHHSEASAAPCTSDAIPINVLIPNARNLHGNTARIPANAKRILVNVRCLPVCLWALVMRKSDIKPLIFTKYTMQYLCRYLQPDRTSPPSGIFALALVLARKLRVDGCLVAYLCNKSRKKTCFSNNCRNGRVTR